MQKLPLLFCCWWLSQISQILCQNEAAIHKIFELLEQGEKQIELKNETDVVLVLGPTGSGKSTVVQWIAGDNTNLISKETFPDSGEYFIEDTNDKVGSSTASKTLFPELVVDAWTKTTFYDFAGFGDTRSSSHDIAASSIMKSVLNHVKNVKLLFVTSYFTVQKGMDRVGFPGLLKNIDDLIGRDIDKFKNSIALVVSKVDNHYIKQGRRLVLKPDSTVITGIANYLRKVKETLKNNLDQPYINDKKKKFSTNAIKIINILLTQEDGEYTRIKLFRRPDQKGPLREIVLLTEGKLVVQKMISESLRFTHTYPNDFGYTISDNSKLEINDLVAEINDQVTDSIGGVVTDIQEHLKSFVEPVRENIDANNLTALSMNEALEFAIQFEKGQRALFGAVDYFTHLSGIDGIGEMLATYLSKLGMEVSESMVENMSKFSKYFDFFQLFRETPLPVASLSWVKSFQSLLSYLTKSQQSIKDKSFYLAEGINFQITSDVDFIADNIGASFKTFKASVNISSTTEMNLLEAKAFYDKLVTGFKLITKLVQSVKVVPTPQLLSDEISKTLNSMDFELPTDALSKISAKSHEFEILQKVSKTNFSFPSAQWSNSFQTVVHLIANQLECD